MAKRENFTVRMGEELKQRMRDHPEINWSHVIREHVRSMLEDLEQLDRLSADSRLTEEDQAELGAMIDAAATDRAQSDAPADGADQSPAPRSK